MSDEAIVGWTLFGAVLLIAFGIYAGIQETAACEKAGGKEKTKWSGGISTNGDYVSTSVTFCLSPDGRILR